MREREREKGKIFPGGGGPVLKLVISFFFFFSNELLYMCLWPVLLLGPTLFFPHLSIYLSIYLPVYLSGNPAIRLYGNYIDPNGQGPIVRSFAEVQARNPIWQAEKLDMEFGGGCRVFFFPITHQPPTTTPSSRESPSLSLSLF